MKFGKCSVAGATAAASGHSCSLLQHTKLLGQKSHYETYSVENVPMGKNCIVHEEVVEEEEEKKMWTQTTSGSKSMQ